MPGSTNYPASLDSHTGGNPFGFAEAVNLKATTLNGAIDAAVATITVVSTAGFPTRGLIVIDSEVITYTGTTATTFTGCVRGTGGTAAAAHVDTTWVALVPVAANHNDLAAAIVALQTKLGTGASTAVANQVLRGTGSGASAFGAVAYGDLDVATLASLLADADLLRPPAIINGGFDVWQRGTSFVSPATNSYLADRWQWAFSTTTAVVTVQRSTDVPAVGANAPKLNYSQHVDVTTADAAVGAGDYAYLVYWMEGHDLRQIAQKQFTLSFWVKSTKTGVHCVAFRNVGPTFRSYVAEYTVIAADTWEYKTITVSASPSAGDWNYETDVGLGIFFTLMNGVAALQGTANTWNSANNIATANQVNVMDNVANDFKITGLRIVLGATGRPYLPRSYVEELLRCKRYYQQWGGDVSNEQIGEGQCDSTTTAIVGIPLVPEMRAAPTLSVSAAGDFMLRVAGASTACTSVVSNSISKRSAGLAASVAAGLTAGQGVILMQNGAAGTQRLRLAAELA